MTWFPEAYLTLVVYIPYESSKVGFTGGATDWKLLTALFRKNREVFSQPEMQVFGPSEAAPFNAELTTDEELIEAMRTIIDPSNAHQCCSAAMLPKHLGGVVSSEQKVYGVTGLRVADISYWPFQLSGAPTATMYASGERVSSYYLHGRSNRFVESLD